MNEKQIIAGVVLLLIVVGGILFMTSSNAPTDVPSSDTATTSETAATASGPNVALAQCLKDNGVTFYGAWWCPHCKAQKELFGDAVPALPYVECATKDGKSQTAICKEKKIEGYPTWEFKDGSRLNGVQTFAVLAASSSCTQALPK